VSLTIVVPAHGEADILEPLLVALDEQAAARGARLPVVVADDASAIPLSRGLMATDRPHLDVRVVRREVNGGPGAARNAGLAEVTTPWVAFLDADTVPTPRWLAGLEGRLAGAGAPDVIEGRTRIPGDRPVTPFTHATEAAPPAQHVAGNVAYRTDVLRAAGGFDERFYDRSRRLHFREDAELAFRLEERGARFTYEPDLVVDHPPLPESYWTPVRLARRYYFDPLLARRHPEAFRNLNAERRVGPVSLRRARHVAALLMAGSAAGVVAGRASGRAGLTRVSLAGLAAAWAANVVATGWRRTVRPRDVVPLVGVSALVPWVYLWNYWRGVRRFRCRPRL